MPHDPYAELAERLSREATYATHKRPMGEHDPCITTMREAATALARLSAPVTEEEIEPLARRLAKIYTHGDPTKEREVWEFYKAEARAALAAHRAGRGM